jgi:hypothetical protein
MNHARIYAHYFLGGCFLKDLNGDRDEAALFGTGFVIGFAGISADLGLFKPPPISDSARSQ